MRIELKHTNLNMGVMGALTDSLERIISQLYKQDKSSCCPSYLIILFASYTSKKLKKKFRFLCIPLFEDIIWDLWKLATDFSYPTVHQFCMQVIRKGTTHLFQILSKMHHSLISLPPPQGEMWQTGNVTVI